MNRPVNIAPIIVSVIILVGFCAVSWMALKPETVNVKENVVMYLLGAWQSLAAGVVYYWVGSSASSAKKDETIARKDDTIQSMAAKA